MADRKIWKLKFVGLLLGCIVQFVTGSVFVFRVYQGVIKDTFNCTQTEGLGSEFMYMVALNTNGINSEKKHAGKVLGLLNSMFGIGQDVFPLLYYHLFTHGDITDTGNQNFPGNIILLIICYSVVGFMCIFFLRIHIDENSLYTPLQDIENVSGKDVTLKKSTDDSPDLQIGSKTTKETCEQRL